MQGQLRASGWVWQAIRQVLFKYDHNLLPETSRCAGHGFSCSNRRGSRGLVAGTDPPSCAAKGAVSLHASLMSWSL